MSERGEPTMPEQIYEGGCLCGAVRYRASGAPRKPHYCHCRMCQLALGAPLSAWVNFPLESFAWTAVEPAWYRSSPRLRRGFCPTCGTSLCTLHDNDDEICMTLASLDDPAQIAPILHMWTSSQTAWLEVDDGLPRHAGQA
jgi:hypothetical protein